MFLFKVCQLIFLPIRSDFRYGFPVPAGLRHFEGRARKASKWAWRAVHGMEEWYLKRTMWVMGVMVEAGGYIEPIFAGRYEN
jgi:hypothetical protein